MRRLAPIACVLAAASMLLSSVLFVQADERTDETRRLTETTRRISVENCDKIHTVVITLDDIVQSGVKNLRAYRDEGTITEKQYQRAVEDNYRARDKLAGADCPARDRVIR